MTERGHGRSRSYFSEFTLTDAQSMQSDAEQQQELHKLESEDQFDSRAENVVRGHRRNTSLTLPDKVRFSVNRPPPQDLVEKMARPRSPQKKHNSTDVSYTQVEMKLDQALLGIRQKLLDLSSERTRMETQMDALANGIREACIECHRQAPKTSASATSSRRRVKSVGDTSTLLVQKHSSFSTSDANRPKHTTSSSTDATRPKLASFSSHDTPRPKLSGVRDRSSTSSSSSRENLKRSPILGRPSLGESMTSSYSLASSLGDSLSSSLSQPFLDHSLRSTNSKSVDSFVEDWLSNTAIPELPESPKSRQFPQSPPLINIHAPPITSGWATLPHRQHSVTPSMQRRDTPPKVPVHLGSSLTESSLAQIRDDEPLQCSSSQVSLSQASSCSGNEGSPRMGNTQILRRSSLTGQIERIDRKPKLKRGSSFSSPHGSPKKLKTGNRPLSSSFSDLKDARSKSALSGDPRKDVTYRRTPGKCHSGNRLIHHRSVIIPSIETTV